MEREPTLEQAWIALVRLASAEGPEAAAAVAAEAAEAAPESTQIQWIRASALEQNGDIPGAIAVYEEIYERDRRSLVVANNLASLLSTTSGDPETIARAERISRRLKGTDVPAFQDTYGWLAFLSGRTEEALEYLRPAAAGLPEDPQVQFHLASALAEAGDAAGAREALADARALAEARLAADGDSDGARTLLDRITRLELETPAAEGVESGAGSGGDTDAAADPGSDTGSDTGGDAGSEADRGAAADR